MVAIVEDRIKIIENAFVAECICGKVVSFTTKMGALKMLNRGACRNCKRDYRSIITEDLKIYKLGDLWGKLCSGCGKEQLYTRKDHAKQSYVADWQCKACVVKAKGFSNNKHKGNKERIYNLYKNQAKSRGVYWDLFIDDMFHSFNGCCAMTGWDISIEYSNKTASLDRIDSKKGYTFDNIQWVHNMVNMSKGAYDNKKFIDMCRCIGKTYSI